MTEEIMWKLLGEGREMRRSTKMQQSLSKWPSCIYGGALE